MKTLPGFILLLLGTAASLRADDKPVIVHEWGTFTCLQDEQGHALGGINVDDEPVPSFVWGAYSTRALAKKAPVYAGFGLPPYSNFSKGWTPADHDVTMRLETPVIYFYPPKDEAPQAVPPLDVHVTFHGGLLSQYYPYAVGSGFPSDFPNTQEVHIGDYTTSLDWKGVRLGSTATPVQTDDKVWTTPREVGASPLEVKAQVYEMIDKSWQQKTETQAEHFLFYRGIGHINPPIYLKEPFTAPFPTHSEEQGLEITSQNGTNNVAADAVYDQVWMVKILANGACGFATLSNVSCKESTTSPGFYPINAIESNFGYADSNCTFDNLAKLKTSMHDALVKEGLYADEATAMLKTWELSYFKSPGLRFFYIVPRAWVDQVLPLTITGAPTQITRVMVGRIELISDAQKTILSRISAGPCPNLQALKEAAENALEQRKLSDSERQSYYGGEKPLSDLGIPIPPFVQDYLSLGRFRDALIVNEQQQHPSPALAQFIKDGELSVAP